MSKPTNAHDPQIHTGKVASGTPLGRRAFLRAGTGIVGGTLAIHALQYVASVDASENGPPHVPDWSRPLGASVDDRPYGAPSPHETQVVRRGLKWITATRESSVNFTPLHELDGIITPNGLCFERHHAGTPDIPPSEHRLMLNGLVDRPLLFTMDDLMRFPCESHFLFPGMRSQRRSRVVWRSAQRLSIYPRHGPLRAIYRRASEDRAQRGRTQKQCQMDSR